MKKKIIAVLLSACMLVSACPTGAFAMSDEETNTYTATGDVMQGGTPVVDETPAPEETASPEETPTPTPVETPAPVEVEAQATPAAGAEEAAPAKQSAETGIALTMLRPDDEKPKVDTYRFYDADDADGKELTEWKQTVAAGEELLEPPAPTKENARFVGWYVGESETPLSFGKVTTVSGTEVTVTARFEEYSYVYFMNEDGTQVVYYTAAGVAGENVAEADLNAATAKVELTMGKEKGVVGWSTTPSSDTPETITFAAGVTYVYPVVKTGFWVTFNTDGGDYMAPQFRMKPLDLSTVTPTRNGYTFDGWYDADGKPVTTVSAEATVTAQWTESSNTQYRVFHWQENANDDGYSLKETETQKGKTGSETKAAAKEYDGFTAETITQQTIAGDGSTIVNIKYKRNVYSVKFMGYGDNYVCGKEEHKHNWDCGYGWKCDKEEHWHNDNCRYGELTDKTITAKYGAQISKLWPTEPQSAWKTTKNGSTYQSGIDTMPLNGATFYANYTNSTNKQTASYYVELLPDETAENTSTYNGKTYKLDHQDTTLSDGWLTITDEDKYPITGFTFVGGSQNGQRYNNAKFYYDRNSYGIKFVNGTQEANIKTVNYKYEESIENAGFTPTRPSDVKEGFVFAGWYENRYGEGTAYDFTGKTMPAQNITLYAKWQAPVIEAKVYLTASADGESVTIEIPYGTKLSDSEDFKALLEKFKEEQPSAWIDSNGALFNVDTELYSSVTISPFFPSAKDDFTVTYVEDKNENVATDNQKYVSGSSARVLPPENSENFRAWKTEDNKLIYPGDKITVTKNTTLTAVYTNKPQTETITYHYNFTDKDGNYNADTFEDGNHPKNTTATVRSRDYVGFTAPTGYKFLGWATTPDSNTVTYKVGATVFVDANGDNDLYAVWQVKTYTVTWVDEDGTTLIDQKDYEYGAIPKFEGVEPTKAADAQYTYTFKGWDKDYTEVKGNQTYVAVYEKTTNKYTVKWVDEDGTTLIDQKDYEYGAIPKFEGVEPTKAADAQYTYTFKGWDKDYTEVKGNQTYVAVYEKTTNKYNVTYDLNGGEWTEATNEFKYEYKATVEVIKTVPTREGYKFSGWRSEEVTIENDAFTMPAKDVVLKAVWEANPTPTPIPSEEPTPTPAPTEEPTPTPAPTEEPTPTPAPTEEPTPTPAPTEEPTPTPAPTEESTPTPAPTEEPTPTPAPTEEPTPTPAPTEESTPTPAPNPNPNPNPATPTPTPVAPVVPATVATPTPKPTATPSTTPSDNGGKGDGNNDGEIGEAINDNETPLANGEDIADNATPLAGLGTGAWALINLILTIVTTLLSILLLIGYIGKKKKALEDEDGNVVLDENGKEVMEYEKNKKGLWRLISIIPALIAIIVFIFTEDMTLPMIFVDKWTLLHVVIALVQVVVMVLCKKKKDENDEDENAANA